MSSRSGQKRTQHGSCQSHRAQKTECPSPAGTTGRWLPQDNDQVTSAEWTSHQDNRLTLTHQGRPSCPTASSTCISPGLHPRTEEYITVNYWFTKYLNSVKKRGVKMSWKNINRLYVGVEGELNFLLFTRDSVIASVSAKWLGVNLSLDHSYFLWFWPKTPEDAKFLPEKSMEYLNNFCWWQYVQGMR